MVQSSRYSLNNTRPHWLVAILLLCITSFSLPASGYFNRPAIQNEQAYCFPNANARTVSYTRLLPKPVFNYRIPVYSVLRVTALQAHLQILCAAEECRHFETVPYIRLLKVAIEPSPAAIAYII